MSTRKPILSRQVRHELKRAERALAQGDREESEKAYLSAIALEPEDERPILLYAKALCRWGREDEALERVRSVVKKHPLNPYVHFVAGMIRFDRGENEDARAEFDNCLELEPQNPSASAFLTLLGAGSAEGMTPSIHSGLWDNEFLSRLLLFLEKRSSGVGKHPLVDGSAPAESAVWGTPRDRKARAKDLAYRGHDLLEDGLPQSALEHLLLCIDLDPALSEDAALAVGRAYCVLGNLNKAVEWLRKISEGHSDRAEGDLWMGEVSRRRGDCDKALGYYDQAFERLRDPETRTRIHFLRGLCLVRQSRLSEAREAFRQALSVAPLHLVEEYILIAKDVLSGTAKRPSRG